jgi:dGTPase
LGAEDKCTVRTDFERDANRILYSIDFRRLRHKTQVFFNAKNDHICTRMEHVLYVSSISSTIARTLNLNQDLTQAIALGHDLGHAPFGHSGEKVLDRCLKEINPHFSFRHEQHSLRVVDRLGSRVSREKINEKSGLNLTFEVRDGIACHCGENYSEYKLIRNTCKELNSLYDTNNRLQMPYTLEACVVRLVDKIAYVGRDIEDAVRVNLIDLNDISKDVLEELGNTNGEIINTLVCDLIENSYGRDCIQLSREKGEALEKLIRENVRLIYRADKIIRYEKTAENIIQGLFISLLDSLKDPDKIKTSEFRVFNKFASFMQDKAYGLDEPDEQKVVDYIAGMTDNFALSCFEEIYWL